MRKTSNVGDKKKKKNITLHNWKNRLVYDMHERALNFRDAVYQQFPFQLMWIKAWVRVANLSENWPAEFWKVKENYVWPFNEKFH